MTNTHRANRPGRTASRRNDPMPKREWSGSFYRVWCYLERLFFSEARVIQTQRCGNIMYCREKASRATFDGTNDHSHRKETSFAVSDSVGRTDFNTKIVAISTAWSNSQLLNLRLSDTKYESIILYQYSVNTVIYTGTHYLHGKPENLGWKIKWFPPFRLGSFRKYGLSSEATQYFYSF